MATNQSTNSPTADNSQGMIVGSGPNLPYSAEVLGLNFPTLIAWAVALVVIAALLIGGYRYAYIIYPQNVLDNSEQVRPVRSQIPLDAMPVLPASLAEQYDIINDAQIAQLDTFDVSDLDGNVRIPYDQAVQMMLEQGAFEVREGTD